jgi:hypothetical protein
VPYHEAGGKVVLTRSLAPGEIWVLRLVAR